jgi:hypothetical protein
LISVHPSHNIATIPTEPSQLLHICGILVYFTDDGTLNLTIVRNIPTVVTVVTVDKLPQVVLPLTKIWEEYGLSQGHVIILTEIFLSPSKPMPE